MEKNRTLLTVCAMHIQNYRSLLHNGQEPCLKSHLSMQGRWNMWWQWGKLLTVSPSWKSCICTNAAMFILQYTISESFISRYRHLLALTRKSVKTNLKANWTRNSVTGCIKIVVSCNFDFWDFFNQISRQTFGSAGVKEVLNLIKACFNSTHLIIKSKSVSNKRKCISKFQSRHYNKSFVQSKLPDFGQHSTWLDQSSLARASHSVSWQWHQSAYIKRSGYITQF